jgi:hypothetical protein
MNRKQTEAVVWTAAAVGIVTAYTVKSIRTIKEQRKIRKEIDIKLADDLLRIKRAAEIVGLEIKAGKYDGRFDIMTAVQNDLAFYQQVLDFDKE